MSQPPVSGVYRAVWPIVDDTFTREELIAEAQHALAALAAEDAVILTGPATWDTTRTGAEVPGWETWDGYVLIAEAPGFRGNTPDPAAEAANAVADVDWTAIEIALAGERPVKLTASEKRVAVQLAERQRGMTRTAIAARLHLSGTTVNKYAEDDLAIDWTVAA
jgi:DNA-binding CsgD family transcriptional regulator